MSNKDETYKDERTPHQRAYDDATAVVAGPHPLEDDAQRNLGRCYRELLLSIITRAGVVDKTVWSDLPADARIADGTEDPGVYRSEQ